MRRLSQIMTKEKSLAVHSVEGKKSNKTFKIIAGLNKSVQRHILKKNQCEKHRLGESF